MVRIFCQEFNIFKKIFDLKKKENKRGFKKEMMDLLFKNQIFD